MKLEGEHTFPVSRPELWNALLDPDLLGRVLPGAEPLELVGENTYRAGMTVAIGPVKGRFQGTLALSDLVPPTSYQMKIDGSGPAGFLRGSGGIELVEAGGSTLLRYAMDAQVGGRIASVGQRLIESSGRAIAKQGLEGLERELAARGDRTLRRLPPLPSAIRRRRGAGRRRRPRAPRRPRRRRSPARWRSVSGPSCRFRGKPESS